MGQAQTSDQMHETVLPSEPTLREHSEGIRVGRELIKATQPFAVESVAKKLKGSDSQYRISPHSSPQRAYFL